MIAIPKVVLLMDDSRVAGRMVLHGIAEYARIHGPWIFHTEPPYYMNPSRKRNMLDWVKKWQAHGIVMLDCDMFRGMDKLGIPIIISHVVRKHPPKHPCILSDGQTIGRMAAEYFIDRRYRHFAFCGFKDMPWSQNRMQGFCQTIHQTGYSAHCLEGPIFRQPLLWGNESNALLDWLKTLPQPIAIMACNDDRGRQILNACRMGGIRVPEDVAVLGVDNDPLVCGLSFPLLSSIALNFRKGGYQAAELLHNLMAGKKVTRQQITVEPLYIETRHSTDNTALHDPLVANAICYIRNHLREPLQIEDVAQAVSTSRRTLYQKFQEVLGRSVHEEIRRVRIQEITKMLLETNFSIAQIAIALNFSSDKHFARYFAKEMGLSPRAFRQKNGTTTNLHTDPSVTTWRAPH